MSRLLKFLMWEVTLLTSLYLWKTYGKQWQAYWEMFTKDNPDMKNSFDEVKEAIDKMASVEKSKKESSVEKEAKVTPSTPASTVNKEKTDSVEKKAKAPVARKPVNPPKEKKVEVKPVAKATKPATKTVAKSSKKIVEVVKSDIANPNQSPAKKSAVKKPKATPAKTDKKD